MSKFPLITERLIIRKFSLEDAAFILELLNEPDWKKYIGDRKIHDLNDAKNYIVNSPFLSYQNFGFGPYLVALKDSNQAIGMTSLIKREGLDNVDIGYALLKRYTGKGYAIEATKATMQYATNELGITPLVAITNADNITSIKLLEKLGFRYDKNILLHGETESVLQFIKA